MQRSALTAAFEVTGFRIRVSCEANGEIGSRRKRGSHSRIRDELAADAAFAVNVRDTTDVLPKIEQVETRCEQQ